MLQSYMHPNYMYSSDTGEIFTGVENIPIFNPELARIHSITIIDRNVNRYNDVAIILTFEHRAGTYMDIAYDNKYRHTRIWKFTGKRWRIISAISYVFG